MSAEPDQAHQVLSPELAQLERLASETDQQIDGGADLVATAPPAPQVDEAAEVAGLLTLIAVVVGKAMPPVAEVYDAEACASIAQQYMRCSEAYGWQWHKSVSSPIGGLIAAACMPAVLNLDKFTAYIEARRKPAPSSAPLPPIEPATAPQYSPGHAGA